MGTPDMMASKDGRTEVKRATRFGTRCVRAATLLATWFALVPACGGLTLQPSELDAGPGATQGEPDGGAVQGESDAAGVGSPDAQGLASDAGSEGANGPIVGLEDGSVPSGAIVFTCPERTATYCARMDGGCLTYEDFRNKVCGPYNGTMYSGRCGDFDVVGRVADESQDWYFFDPNTGALVAKITNQSISNLGTSCDVGPPRIALPSCNIDASLCPPP
ncbi:MAG: hypothetical protein ACREJ3_00155 [Polyangiaceae bacterium]